MRPSPSQADKAPEASQMWVFWESLVFYLRGWELGAMHMGAASVVEVNKETVFY